MNKDRPYQTYSLRASDSLMNSNIYRRLSSFNSPRHGRKAVFLLEKTTSEECSSFHSGKDSMENVLSYSAEVQTDQVNDSASGLEAVDRTGHAQVELQKPQQEWLCFYIYPAHSPLAMHLPAIVDFSFLLLSRALRRWSRGSPSLWVGGEDSSGLVAKTSSYSMVKRSRKSVAQFRRKLVFTAKGENRCILHLPTERRRVIEFDEWEVNVDTASGFY